MTNDLPPEYANAAALEEARNLARQNLEKLARILEFKVADGRFFTGETSMLNEHGKNNVVSYHVDRLVNIGLDREAILDSAVPQGDIQEDFAPKEGEERQTWQIFIEVDTRHPSFEQFQKNVFTTEVNRAAEYVAAVMDNLPPEYAGQLATKILLAQQQGVSTGSEPSGTVKQEATERVVD